MDTQPARSASDAVVLILNDTAKAVADRDDETRQQRDLRFETTRRMVEAFVPLGVIETILAAQCVMLNATMTDSFHKTLRGEADETRPGTRSNLVAMARQFTGSLDRLKRYQALRAKDQRETAGQSTGNKPALNNRAPNQPAAVLSTAERSTGEQPTPIAPTSDRSTPNQPPTIQPPSIQPPTLQPPTVRTTLNPQPRLPAAAPNPAPPSPAPSSGPAAAARTDVAAQQAITARQPTLPPTNPAQTHAAETSTPPAPIPTVAPRESTAAAPHVNAEAPVDLLAEMLKMAAFYEALPNAVANCETNPEAVAALRVGDAARFARATGIAAPSEAFLAAAARARHPLAPRTQGPRPPGETDRSRN